MSLFRTTGAAALVTGLSLLAAPAQAQYSESSAWITPFAGAYFGGSLDPEGGNLYNINKLDVGTAFTFGARLGYKFNQSIGLVFEYAHADPGLTVKCNGPFVGPNDYCGKEIDLSSNIYEGTFNFYFGNNPDHLGHQDLAGTPLEGLRDPVAIDTQGYRLGLQTIATDPLGFLRRGAKKIASLYGFPDYALHVNSGILVPDTRGHPELEAVAQAKLDRQRARDRLLDGPFLLLARGFHLVLLALGALGLGFCWKERHERPRVKATTSSRSSTQHGETSAPSTPAGPPRPRAAPTKADRKVTLTLPAGVVRQLRERMAGEDTTMRALVLEALLQAGYAVPAGEIRDRRRAPPGEVPHAAAPEAAR